MATLTIAVSDFWLSEFEARYSSEERDEVLAAALLDLVQDDPYSPEALAEDERSIAEVEAGGGISHERMMVWLDALARGEHSPPPQ